MTFEDWWEGQGIPVNVPNYAWFKTLANYAYAAGERKSDSVYRCPACGRDLENLMLHTCPYGTVVPLHITTLEYAQAHYEIDRAREEAARRRR